MQKSNNDVFAIKLTAAIVVDGEIATAGEVVELTRKEAQNILHRGLGELHGEQDLDDQGDDRFAELDAMKVDELKKLAADEDYDLGAAKTKAEIIAAILKAEQAD